MPGHGGPDAVALGALSEHGWLQGWAHRTRTCGFLTTAQTSSGQNTDGPIWGGQWAPG